MWCFIEHIQLPEKKQKLNENNIKERNNSYDREKCNRTFQTTWTTDREWLNYDEEKNVMQYNWCAKLAKKKQRKHPVLLQVVRTLKLNQ